MTQKAFYFNQTKCTGCKTCQVACKETYMLGINNLFRRVYSYQGGSWKKNKAGSYVPNNVFSYFTSISCNHCTNPACVENCPTGASKKDGDTGIVWIDKDICIGCKTCQTVCPYGAPTYNEDEGIMTKCDMCMADLKKGKTPVCVAGCPMRALDCGNREELVAKYGEGNVEIEPLPKNSTEANLIINPHPKAVESGKGTGEITNFAEEL